MRSSPTSPDAARPPALCRVPPLWLWFTVLFANFAEAIAGGQNRNSRQTQNDEWEDQQIEHGKLNIVGIYLFSEILRRTSDHEAGDKDGDDNEGQHAIKAGPHTTKDHFSEQDVRHGHHAAQWCEGIVHRIHSPAARVCSYRSEERRVRNAEPDLLALHVASRLSERSTLIDTMKKWARL